MPAEAVQPAADLFSMMLTGGGGVGGGAIGLFAIQKLFLQKEPNGKMDKVLESGRVHDEAIADFRKLHADHQQVLVQQGQKLDDIHTETQTQTGILRNMDKSLTTFVAVMEDRAVRN